MDAILSRRSIRKYTNQNITDSIVKELLEAAMCAPSTDDSRPWHFIVIRDKERLRTISSIRTFADMVQHAPVAILVCGDRNQEIYQGSLSQDCSAAVENILIAATDKGLGSVWVGIYPLEKRMADFRDMFMIPDYISPFTLIPIGYPAEENHKVDRYDESIVHHDRW